MIRATKVIVTTLAGKKYLSKCKKDGRFVVVETKEQADNLLLPDLCAAGLAFKETTCYLHAVNAEVQAVKLGGGSEKHAKVFDDWINKGGPRPVPRAVARAVKFLDL